MMSCSWFPVGSRLAGTRFAGRPPKCTATRVEGVAEIEELCVLGDWAYTRTHLKVTMTPPASEAVTRSGYTLTILRKESDGKWRLSRDANMLTVQK